VRFDVIFTVFKLVHPLNVKSLILVTSDGIVIDDNDEHPENAYSLIDVTEDGIVISTRLSHLQKALLPIDVRFDVIFTIFKSVLSKNA